MARDHDIRYQGANAIHDFSVSISNSRVLRGGWFGFSVHANVGIGSTFRPNAANEVPRD